ncbi:DUF4424 family protein [Zavarzinia sp.]|uniref:DUF4424 family protein n=1 Tax=Zavarzinia sp. TaxID=2027920 RepID=UPI003565C5D0
MRVFGGAAAVLAAVLACGPARANDSSAAIGAGGLELVQDHDITMVSEDLRIAADRIDVHYRFLNQGMADADRVVAFPLPPLDFAELENTGWDIPNRQSTNFVDFQVSVDGKPVTPSLEARAFVGQRDVSDLLRPLGLLEPSKLLLWAEDDPFAKATPAAMDELEKQGLITRDPPEPDGTRYTHPKWTLKVSYYWHQTFPAGKPVEVDHHYRPVTGSFMLYPEVIREAAMVQRFCIDSGVRKAIAQRFDLENEEAGVFVVDYILTTGANWAGPIGRFHLTVDKGAPDNVVAFCADGVKKTGPTTFEVEKKDFVPTRDLSIMIVQKGD